MPLAHLLFGIDKGRRRRFRPAHTGEVGTGKTTLSRLLLEQLPEDARMRWCSTPQNAVELLETIGEELHIDIEGGARFEQVAGRCAQCPPARCLCEGIARRPAGSTRRRTCRPTRWKQVRLLTNLETDTQKLLQILLLGQPELREMVASR